MNMSAFTVKEIGEKLGIDATAAYGLVQYLRARGLVTEQPSAREPGARGKPAIRFELKPNATSVLTDDIRKLA